MLALVLASMVAPLLAAAPPPTMAPALPTPSPTPWILPPLHDGVAGTPAPELDGRRLLLDCEKKFLSLRSMKGTIRERSLIVGRDTQPTEIESDFWYRRFDDVRFEKTAPLPHTVIWNGKNLWVWSPKENAAIEAAAADVDASAKSAFDVIPGFGLDVLAPIQLDEYRADVKRIDGTHVVVTLTAVDTSQPHATMQVVVEPERRVVDRLTVLVGGVGMVDTDFASFVEPKAGTFFATQVHSRILLPDGSAVEKLRLYERMKYDVPIDDSKFTFAVPAGARHIPLQTGAASASAAGGSGK